MSVAQLWQRFLVRRFRGWSDVQAVGPDALGHLLDEPTPRRRQIADLGVRLHSGDTYLLDAKHKQDDAASVHDLRQVLVYAMLSRHRGRAPRAVGLVYPSVREGSCRTLGRARWAGAEGVEVLEIRLPFRIPGRGVPPTRFGDLLEACAPVDPIRRG